MLGSRLPFDQADRTTRARLLLTAAHRLQAGKTVDPDVARAIGRALAEHLRTGTPIERTLGIAPARGQPRAALLARQAERDELLAEVAAAIPGTGPAALVAAIHAPGLVPEHAREAAERLRRDYGHLSRRRIEQLIAK